MRTESFGPRVEHMLWRHPAHSGELPAVVVGHGVGVGDIGLPGPVQDGTATDPLLGEAAMRVLLRVQGVDLLEKADEVVPPETVVGRGEHPAV